MTMWAREPPWPDSWLTRSPPRRVPGSPPHNADKAGGASWLQVTAAPATAVSRPTVSASLGRSWGFHLDEFNLALGNLVADVGLEGAVYR
ncbi:MAG: hypothetical protein WAL61_16250 [Acidimicrobiales bacterium]